MTGRWAAGVNPDWMETGVFSTADCECEASAAAEWPNGTFLPGRIPAEPQERQLGSEERATKGRRERRRDGT